MAGVVVPPDELVVLDPPLEDVPVPVLLPAVPPPLHAASSSIAIAARIGRIGFPLQG
jgi:hypothetical protein